MSVTIPTNDWNFLVSGAAGDTIFDNISNVTATYGSNLTSDTTDGVLTTGSSSPNDNITLPSLNFNSSFSFEWVARHNSNKKYGGICWFKESSGDEIVIDNYTTIKSPFLYASFWLTIFTVRYFRNSRWNNLYN